MAKPLMDAKAQHEDPKKGLHDVGSFIVLAVYSRVLTQAITTFPRGRSRMIGLKRKDRRHPEHRVQAEL